MKRISILAIAFLFCALSLTSCQKDNNTGMSSRVFKGVIANSAKSELSGLNVIWDAADAVIIANGVDHARYTATNINGTTCDFQCAVGEDVVGPPYYAMHPADNYVAHNRMTLSAVQQYRNNNIENSPMYAASNTNILYFHNLCGVLKLVLQKANTTVYSINITTDKRISGDFDIQAVNEDGETCHQIVAGTETTNNTITLLCVDGTDISTEKTFFIYLPAGNYGQFDITINAGDGLSSTLRLNESSVTFDRNHIKTIERRNGNLVFTNEHFTSGKFSVSSTQKVWFAKGNLFFNRADDGTETWTIADHQYEFYPENNANHQDKFCWPDSVTHYGTTLTRHCNDHDINSCPHHGPFTDWGQNVISNDPANTWRTLSINEWNYLLNQRTMTNGAPRYDKCRFTINGHQYSLLVIYPDDFPAACAINSDHWTSPNLAKYYEFNSLGCAMLPAAGRETNRRNGHLNLQELDRLGRYASSTRTSSTQHAHMAFVDGGGNGGNVAIESDDIACGNAVRLVRVVPTNN